MNDEVPTDNKADGASPTDANGRPLRTDKSAATRRVLLRSAREVFERRGFHETRVGDIVKGAGTAHGTFYRYFRSKEDVFRELATVVTAELLETQEQPALLSLPQGLTEREQQEFVEHRLRLAIERFINVFRENARLIELLEEVATYDAGVRASRLEVRNRLSDNTTQVIRHLAARGFLSPDINAELAAELIGAMIDRFAYTRFVLGARFNEVNAIDALTSGYLRLICWPRALRQPDDGRPVGSLPVQEVDTGSSEGSQPSQ